mmetsp:Transcript_29171/g.44107  ORF Transcript_29171/g.44107 Transcript_29171/m.44107 type:complete len:228 (-) Transcript_29171:616-1299(-)
MVLLQCIFFCKSFLLSCCSASNNLQRSRNDGPRVHKEFSVNVLDDAKVLVGVVDVDFAGCIPPLVPGKELPNGSHGDFNLPDNVSQERETVESLHLARGCVVNYHVESRHRSVVKHVGGQFLAGSGGHHASTKGWEELEPPQNGNHGETKEGGVKRAVQVLRLGINVLGNPAHLGCAPRTRLELVKLEEETGLAGPVLEGFCFGVFIGLLDGQKEWRGAKYSVWDGR